MDPLQTSETSNQANNFMVPLSIVIAGLVIAGAVFYSKSAPNQQASVQGALESYEFPIRPIGSEDHILGNPNAEVVMVEYSDTGCPFCKRFHETMHTLVDKFGKDGKMAWVYRHYPITQLHPNAFKEAEATECAATLGGNDGFWRFIDRLYEVTPSLDPVNRGPLNPAELPKIAAFAKLNAAEFQTCYDSGRYKDKVQADYDDATQNAGGQGTPHIIFIFKNGMPQGVKDFVGAVNLQFRKDGQPDAFLLADDGKSMAMIGALPLEMVEQVIELTYKK